MLVYNRNLSCDAMDELLLSAERIEDRVELSRKVRVKQTLSRLKRSLIDFTHKTRI